MTVKIAVFATDAQGERCGGNCGEARIPAQKADGNSAAPCLTW